MAIAYPTRVPSCIQKGSLSEAPVDSVLTSNIDGLPNTRNRHEMEMYIVSWNIQMSNVEFDILMEWYHTEIMRVLSFNFDDPLTSVTKEYFFTNPPTSSHVGGNQFIVKFNLETAP